MKIPKREGFNRLVFIVLALTASDFLRIGANLTTKYKGKPVIVNTGGTKSFTWKFTGIYDEIRWGIVTPRGAIRIDPILVYIPINQQQGQQHIDVTITVPLYNGLVSGSYTVDSQGDKVATFTLQSVSTSFEGLYGCALGSSVADIDFVYLQIRDVPSFTQRPSRTYTYNEGRHITLGCQAIGRPVPRVQWLRARDGAVLASGSSTADLRVSPFRRAEEGSYMCVASNSEGTITAATKLTASYIPEQSIFTTNHFNHTAVEGERVIFTCNSVSIPQSRQFFYFSQDGSTKFLQAVTSEPKFVINSVRSDQQGWYFCIPHNSVGNGPQKSLFLTVNVPARIAFVTGSQTAEEGSVLSLSCRATGNPLPAVRWLKDGGVVGIGSPLTIGTISRSGAGKYFCLAENGVGNSVMKFVNVIINYRSTFDPTKSSMSSTKTWIGRDVKLSCASDGVPTPNIAWRRPDGTVIITQNSHYSQLKLNPSSKDDFGNYTCSISNGVGDVFTHLVGLLEMRKPSKPVINYADCDIGARTLFLVWNAPVDNGGSSILSYIMKLSNEEGKLIMVNETKNTAFRYEGLQMETSYKVELAARNVVNVSLASKWMGRTKMEGKPGAPNLLLGNSEQNNVSVLILWQKPFENGSAIFMYSVYKMPVIDVSKNGAVSDKAWVHVANTTKLETQLILTAGKRYFIVVTAWNKFGESIKDGSKIKQVPVRSSTEQYNQITGASRSVLHTAYGVVIAALLIAVILLLGCVLKGYCRTGKARTVGRLQSILLNTVNKSPATPFTTPSVFENELATSLEEISLKALSARDRQNLPQSTNTRHPHKQISIASGNNKGKDFQTQEEHHYMPLVPGLRSIKKKNGGSSGSDRHLPDMGQIKDVRKLPCQNVTVHENRTEDKVHYMSLIPGLRSTNKTNAGSNNAIYMGLESQGTSKDILPKPKDAAQWEIPTANLFVDEELAAGKFVVTSKGRVRGLNGTEGERPVAIKTIQDVAPMYYRKGFVIEMEVMQSLKPHPNIIGFLGHVVSSAPMRIVVEYGDYGDLLNYLRLNREINNPYFREVKPESMIDASKLLRFAKDIAKGMDYISSQNVVHLHLKASSVLVGREETCKIGNFKLARHDNDQEEDTEAIKMIAPLKWSAYETIMFGNYSTQSDIWSYGVTLYEIFTIGGCPYPKISKESLIKILQKGERIPKPFHVDNEIYRLMTDCWLEDPYERPDWEDLMESLCTFEIDHEVHINLQQFDGRNYETIR